MPAVAIDLSAVRFDYPNQQSLPVLDIPAWTLEKGEQVFVHGPSGSGKSTLLNLLSGLLTPSEGRVTVLGKSLGNMSSLQRDRFRADNVGYVCQQFNLIPYLNAIDNIRLAHQFSKQQKAVIHAHEIKALLANLNIASADWQKPARNLSIGQQQRVAIARALVNKPQILIADEPTSSLDQANRDAFMQLLMSVVTEHKMTLLFVSHDMTLSRYFDRVEALADMSHAGVSV